MNFCTSFCCGHDELHLHQCISGILLLVLAKEVSSSGKPSNLAMIKSSICTYQHGIQLATFVGIVCQDKKVRPLKHQSQQKQAMEKPGFINPPVHTSTTHPIEKSPGLGKGATPWSTFTKNDGKSPRFRG